jgi:hypothetical protein
VNARAWSAAEWAQTLQQAHDALVALRPSPGADQAVWVSYYRRSSTVYRHVAEVDPGHQAHARYWADREKAKADLLVSQTSTGATGRRKAKISEAAASNTAVIPPNLKGMPSSLEQAHEVLSKTRPGTDSERASWAAYHERAALVYAEIAEVDRAHHHEALVFASLARRYAAWSKPVAGAKSAGGNPGRS